MISTSLLSSSIAQMNPAEIHRETCTPEDGLDVEDASVFEVGPPIGRACDSRYAHDACLPEIVLADADDRTAVTGPKRCCPDRRPIGEPVVKTCDVRNQKIRPFHSLRIVHERRFIVTVPGQGYRLLAAVRREADPERPSLPATPQPLHITRLVILPLKLLRAADEYDFLAFSIPDAITSSLSGLEAITVRSSATAARIASEPLDLTALATAADVDAVLHGTLLHDDEGAALILALPSRRVAVTSGFAAWSKPM